ncbi:MAG: hypothetical protein ACYCO3_09550 [Mycobacteriales bacterium]
MIVPADVWERRLEAAEDELDIELAPRRLSEGDGPPLTRAELDDALRRAGEAARQPA